MAFGWALLVACATPKTSSTTEPAAEVAQSCMPGVPAVVAEVDGKPITCEELMAFAGPQVVEAQLEASNTLQNAIDTMIVERVLDAESDAQGLAVEDIVKREIDPKVTPPTDAEIEELYSQNAAEMPGTLEEMKPRLTDYLLQERRGPVFRAYVQQLEEQRGVKRHAPMLRLPVEAGDSPRWGKDSAKVTLIEFSDFQCPACQQAAPVVDAMKDRFGEDKLTVVFRHMPLPFHPEAARAAEASECANEQGKFWGFHDALFGEKKAWSDEDYKAMATDLGLDAAAFEACLSSGRHAETVAADTADGQRVGVNGTPAFFLNGIPIFGMPPEDVFASLIERELAQTM